MSMYNIFMAFPAAMTYAIVTGTKAPVYGATSSAYPPTASWTGLQNGNVDDGAVTVPLPFTFYFNNTGYTSFFPSSNGYITFGTGSGAYSGLSASNPANDKIMFYGGDQSYQRVSYYTDLNNRYVRCRIEGNSGTGGTVGASNTIYEVTFFNPGYTAGSLIEILFGGKVAGGVTGIYSSSALLTGGTFSSVDANQSYVLNGDSTGVNWTISTGYYVNNTGY